jgi:hypothetical protein
MWLPLKAVLVNGCAYGHRAFLGDVGEAVLTNLLGIL